MASVVTRLYADPADAEKTIEVLKTQGFGTLDYTVFTPPHSGDLLAMARAAGVTKKAAPAYARELAAGRTMVLVRAPFGKAAVADQVLSLNNPVKPGNFAETVYVGQYNKKRMRLTGVSFVTGGEIGTYPIFERVTGIKSLIKPRSKTKLSTGTTPFSSMLKMPLLTKSQRSKTKLSKNPTPFSSLLGMRLLIPYKSQTQVW